MSENKMKWFRYWQNNSGGFFKEPARTVYIQAENEDHADSIAEDNDLYFNGVAKGLDCDCCGNRWGHPWDDGEEQLIIEKRDLENGRAQEDGVPAIMIVPFNHDPIFPSPDNPEELRKFTEITLES